MGDGDMTNSLILFRFKQICESHSRENGEKGLAEARSVGAPLRLCLDVNFRIGGVYLQARMEDNAECMLVLIGATPEGRKELIGFQTGFRESAQSWRELLVDLKARGLAIAPKIAAGDGALGFWKALDEVFPSTSAAGCTRPPMF